MISLKEKLEQKQILISDGAWGTFLQKKGLAAGECPELWNVTHPDAVFEIAKSYIDAGSDIVLTNSFGGSPLKLKHYELESRATELNEAAATISRKAAGSDHYVFGSIGPTGAILMMGDVSEQTLYESFRIQSEALEKGGVDAICIETMSAIDEAILAIKAAKESTNLDVICTFTFEKTVNGDYRTMMGVSPAQMAKSVIEAGAAIIGTNCGNGFSQMSDIVKEIRTLDSSIPILVQANAGKPVIANNQTVFPESPEDMAAHVSELISAGANIIGGCCGTTPAHINAIAKVVREVE